MENEIKIPEFENIFSFESLLKSWQEFKKRKSSKSDVAEFASELISNLSDLREDIISGRYCHGGYKHFKVSDPKPRDIHKASVRDRIVHHALYLALYPYFDSKFIFNSYACRLDKGTHMAFKKFRKIGWLESFGDRHTIWVLKCDIKKFFACIDQEILKDILSEHVKCDKTMDIIREVIKSFPRGLPLGNLTSQIFGNVYMDQLDQYIVGDLKIKNYIRYADDFIVLSRDKHLLEELIPKIDYFLSEKLRLNLHPNKISIKTLNSGIDFLGWVHFPNYSVLRTKTKRRMLTNLSKNNSKASAASYMGLLKHGNAHKIRKKVLDLYSEI